ncbi:Shedu anti-phage system protein SduA domain-containing protein [Nocardia sp. NPDC050710]|uniref:Shedu anti-phage system protein SduA domain-containing protein n=1 Tax=Nocardia sp. NPDC050710 TaxID=3157220 RepID=UPI00340C608B
MVDPVLARPPAMEWEEYSRAVMREWQALLSTDPAETEVQTFLELHPSMIPGGLGDVGHGGHHGSEMTAVWREPGLVGGGRQRHPDFMWVTRSSGCITPVLIEIEKPSKRWFTRDGKPTAEFTHAQEQLNDWRAWFRSDANQVLFRSHYLVREQYKNRPIEPYYLLIYGRSSEFEPGGIHRNPDELRFKRDGLRRSNESFMTFDSLRPSYDLRWSLTATMTSHGPRVFAFSPTYSTTSSSGRDTKVFGADVEAAFERSAMMSSDRKRYLAERWRYWHDQEVAKSSWRPVDVKSILDAE